MLSFFLQIRVSLGECSSSHTACLTNQGSLYIWGNGVPKCRYSVTAQNNSIEQIASNQEFINPLPYLAIDRISQSDVISNVACGNRHTLISTQSGSVYSWGFATQGQLGVVLTLSDATKTTALSSSSQTKPELRKIFDAHTNCWRPFLDTPILVPPFGLASEPNLPLRVKQIACGFYHSIVLTDDGSVFAWGEASEGQLGIGLEEEFEVGFVDQYIPRSSYTFIPTPKRVGGALEGKNVIQIACTGSHVCAITHEREVFAWGNWGRRFIEEKEHFYSPQQHLVWSNLHIHSISVGLDHTIAMGSALFVSLSGFSDQTKDRIIQAVGSTFQNNNWNRDEVRLTCIPAHSLFALQDFTNLSENDLTIVDLATDDEDPEPEDFSPIHAPPPPLHKDAASISQERWSLIWRTWRERSIPYRFSYPAQHSPNQDGLRSRAIQDFASQGQVNPTLDQIVQKCMELCQVQGKHVIVRRKSQPGTYITLSKFDVDEDKLELLTVSAKFTPQVTKLGIQAPILTVSQTISTGLNLKYLAGSATDKVLIIESIEKDFQVLLPHPFCIWHFK